MNWLKHTLSVIICFQLLTLFATNNDNYIKGNLLIQLSSNKDISILEKQLKTDFSVSINSQLLSKSGKIWLIEFNEERISTDELLKQIYNYDYIQIAQYNHNNIKQRINTPNDPNYTVQWHHSNGGGSGVIDADMDSDEAWEITTGGYTVDGKRIVVAVIDEGIDINHSDLTIWNNPHEIPENNIDDDNNGFIDDVHGYDFWDDDGNPNVAASWEDHGTHIAGIIGANGNNCLGVAGVNWDVEIMSVRGSSTIESDVIKAYDYVLEMRKTYNRSNGDSGAYVVSTNSSFGVDRANPNNYPLWCGFYNLLGEEGILSAVAGPNLNINIDNEGDVPGACPSNYAICVTNTNQSDDRAFAGYGVNNVDIGAPGSAIYSTSPYSLYRNMTGTSMATPQVAGAVALMQSVICKETIDSKSHDELALYIKNQMLLNGVDSVANLSGEVSSYGRLNLYKCVTAVSANFESEITTPSCNSNNGSIAISAIGKNSPYSYNWSTGATTNLITSISKGEYSITLTNSTGCTNSKTISISDEPIVSSTITNPKCNGINNGDIVVSATGNDSPYFYEWSNGATVYQNTGLSSGNYNLTTTSGSGCISINSFTLKDTLKNDAIIGYVQHDTCGTNSGLIAITPPENFIFNYGECNNSSLNISTQSPYTYQWSNGYSTDTIKDLSSGNFSLTLTSNDGCIFDTSFTINSIIEPGLLTVYESILHLSCYGDQNGWIRIDSISGGNSPFTYEWNNGTTLNTSTGLNAGNYQLTITDNQGCVEYNSFNIVEPTTIAINFSISQMTEKDANDGIIDANISGGTNPYTYNWSNGESGTTISGLTYGNYTISVTDYNNCSTSKTGKIDYISAVNNLNLLNNLIVYPNPTEGIVYFNSFQTINVYNSIGELIISKENTKFINLESFQSGIYIIETDDNSSLNRIKVIKL